MDRHFDKMIDEITPKVNPYVMSGVAYHLASNLLSLVDECAKSIFSGLPANIRYEGLKRCQPLEEYMMASRPREGKRTFDLAKSSFYMFKLLFSNNGKPFQKAVYMYMVHIHEYNIFYINDTMFHCTPVLSDPIISPGTDQVFLRLVRDRITARRTYHTVVIDGKMENHHVVWVGIYRRQKDKGKLPATTNAEVCIAHYLFGKYGVVETFKKYAHTDIVVGGKELTAETHPPEDWVIVESCKVAPTTSKDKFYIPSDLKIAVPRANWNNKSHLLSVGLFYIVDHFPHQFQPDVRYMSSSNLFKRLMGIIFKSGLYGHDKLFAVAEDHCRTLDSHLDTPVLRQLKKMNIQVNDFYDLLFHTAENFNRYILDENSNINSMFGKTLEVQFNLIYDITSFMVKALYAINNVARTKEPTEQMVYDALTKNLTTGRIFALNRGRNIAEQVSTIGDHPFMKIACKVSSQDTVPRSSNAGKKGGNKKGGSVTENDHFHPSYLVCGNVVYLQKANPAAWVHLNPCILVDMVNGRILRPQKFDLVLKKLEADLKGI